MDAEKVVEFLHQLGCANIRVKSKWVECSCPLALWVHKKTGLDRRPSFGVSIESKGPSRWRCLGCTRGGTLPELLWSLKRYDPTKDRTKSFGFVATHDALMDLSEFRAKVDRAEQRVSAAPTAGGWFTGRQSDPEAEAEKLTPLPEEDLSDYFQSIAPKSDAGRYLLKRSIAYPSWERWGLRWHERSRRVAIPVRDYKGRLLGITGRSIDPRSKRPWMHSLGFRRDYVLLGEHLIQPHERTGIAVEGHFDTIYLRALGYAAVGVMGSYVSPYQVLQFRRFFDRVIIFRDGDEPGIKAAERWREALAPHMPVAVPPVVEGRDPDEYSQEETLDILGPPPNRQPEGAAS